MHSDSMDELSIKLLQEGCNWIWGTKNIVQERHIHDSTYRKSFWYDNFALVYR